MKQASFYFAAALAIIPLACFAASPYAGEQSRSIKSLSQQETADYLSGKGMGFAKAAELNGYPGPGHVLELADKLALSPTQKGQDRRGIRQDATTSARARVAAGRGGEKAR